MIVLVVLKVTIVILRIVVVAVVVVVVRTPVGAGAAMDTFAKMLIVDM